MMSQKSNNPSQLTYKEEFKIHAEDIDFNGRMKFYRLCSYLLEMATIHARKLNYGFEVMKQMNHYWVLSRLIVYMNHYPVFDQNIIIETFTKGLNRLFALRDFFVLDMDNNILVRAASAWLAIDKITGRPARPEYITKFHGLHSGRDAIKEVPGKIHAPDSSCPEASIPVKYSDLDINEHVNAGKYISWIQDQFTQEHYRNKQINKFQINYHNETRYGEIIELFFSPDKGTGNNNLVEGKIKSSAEVAFRAKVEWGEIGDP